jgi:uncharacterized protein (DUF1810 family)
MKDPYDLDRFLEAQEHVYEEVLDELENGLKTGHWIWFIFPQLAGLGESDVSEYFAISTIDEARAYMANSILGPRLSECTERVLAIEGKSARDIFGDLDAMKFRSSMTLFAAACDDTRLFQRALDRFFDGAPDPITRAAINDFG